MPELPLSPQLGTMNSTTVELRLVKHRYTKGSFLVYIKTIGDEGLLSQKDPTMNYQNLAPCVHHYQLTEA